MNDVREQMTDLTETWIETFFDSMYLAQRQSGELSRSWLQALDAQQEANREIVTRAVQQAQEAQNVWQQTVQESLANTVNIWTEPTRLQELNDAIERLNAVSQKVNADARRAETAAKRAQESIEKLEAVTQKVNAGVKRAEIAAKRATDVNKNLEAAAEQVSSDAKRAESAARRAREGVKEVHNAVETVTEQVPAEAPAGEPATS